MFLVEVVALEETDTPRNTVIAVCNTHSEALGIQEEYAEKRTIIVPMHDTYQDSQHIIPGRRLA